MEMIGMINMIKKGRAFRNRKTAVGTAAERRANNNYISLKPTGDGND